MKEQIVKYLLDNGFNQNEDIFCKIINASGREIIINGQRHIEKNTIKLEIKFSGEGYIKNADAETQAPTTQWQIIINDNLQDELIIQSLDEFKSYIK